MSLRLFTVLGILASACFAQLSEAEWKSLQAELGSMAQQKQGYGAAERLLRVGQDNSSRAVKFLAKAFPHFADDDAAYMAVVEAIAGMKAPAAADEARKAALKEKDAKTRVAFLEGLGQRGDEEDWTAIGQALKDKDDVVQMTAIRLLGRSRRTDAVPILADFAAALDMKRGHVWEDAKAALRRLTGEDLQFGADYASRWKSQGGKLADADDLDFARRPTTGGDEGGTAVRFFGQEIGCKHFVFVIDVSGSMETTDPYPAGYQGSTSRPPQGSGPDPERMRIFRAKKELLRTLDSLPADVSFNIVAYSSNATPWRQKPDGGLELHKASAATVKEAKGWVEALKADGVTVTDRALQMALSADGVRCVYLLSDGFATADGTNKIPTANILELVHAANRYAKAKIYTFGFKGADEELMLSLAAETGGVYAFIE